MENRKLQRLKLTIACREYLNARRNAVDESETRNLEEIIANAVIPLSFMNDLESMEVENADTH